MLVTQEQWGPWESDTLLQKKYKISSFIYTDQATMRVDLVEVEDQSKKKQLVFSDLILVSKSCSGAFIALKLKQLEAYYGLDFYQKRTFFMFRNSDFCEKLA